MGQYNPHAPLVVGNEFAPVIAAPYRPDLFVERGWSFRGDPEVIYEQGSIFVDSLPAWSVPGHAYLLTLYRRGQETATGPMKTVTVPLALASSNNGSSGGGAPNATTSIANPTDGWYFRFRTSSTGEAYLRLRSDTIPTFLSEPAVSEGKRIVDVSILYTASAEPGNETPVPLEINHYYDVRSERVPYGLADVDLIEPTTTAIRRSRWGEIVTWVNLSSLSPFTDYNERYVWNYDMLTLFETGSDFLVEFRTASAAQDGPREIFLHYAAMQITYCEENREAIWGMVAGADYAPGAGNAPGYRLGRNTQNINGGAGKGFIRPNSLELGPGGGSLQSGGGNIPVSDVTMTVKRADYGPYNNQGDLPLLRALRTIEIFPGHPGVVVNNTIEPGQTNTVSSSDLLPQILAHDEPTAGQSNDEAPPWNFMHTYGVQTPLPVSASSTVVQEILPAADAPETPYPKLRFWARNNDAQAPLRLEIETADQGPVTVAQLSPAQFAAAPEVAEGWRQIDLEVDPALLIDDYSVASETKPAVTDTVHESSGGTTGAWNVTAPAGDLEGQVLLLLHAADAGDIADMGTPTGGTAWTLMHDADNLDGSGDGVARLWQKVGGPAEPASYGLTQNSGADGAAIVIAISGADSNSTTSAELSASSKSNSALFPTPNVVMPAPGGLDLRLTATPFSPFTSGTWTPPDDWVLIAGATPTPFVATGAAVRETEFSGGPQNMRLSSSTTLGYLSVTVTLVGGELTPAAPRWISDTPNVRPWEVLAARVIDPNVEGAFDPALPTQTGVATYGSHNARGDIEGDVAPTGDIDVSVVWGQAMPEVGGLTVAEAVQPVAVVDPECPIAPECIPDGIRYLRLEWTPVDSGYGFVGLGHYELQRTDDTLDPGEWETVATPIHPLVDAFDDYEARVGLVSRYRIRYVHQNGMAGPWSAEVAGEVAAPGVTGAGAAVGVLVFTANTAPERNLAYAQVWTGSPAEDFDFPEADTRELQRLYGRDYQVAFRPVERGGTAFTRNLMVNAATVPVETLEAGFRSLRDLAWADLPYVCVRSDRGDRWLSNVNVPSGVIRRRKLYVAEARITEVTGTPFAPEPTVCEGLTARGTLPSTVYEPRYATTPPGDHLDSTDLTIEVGLRLDQFDQTVNLAARFANQSLIGWRLLWNPDGTLEFRNVRVAGGAILAIFSTDDPVPFEPGDWFALRATYTADSGGGTSDIVFESSPDGQTWTVMPHTADENDPVPADQPDAANKPLTVGAVADGTATASFDAIGGAGGWNGVISYVTVTGDASAVLADPDFRDVGTTDPEATDFTDAAGNEWTVIGGVCTVDRRA